MDLALFDLDHTLLPIDSDYEWGRFLARVGAVDEAHQQLENDRFYRDYRIGVGDGETRFPFYLKGAPQDGSAGQVVRVTALPRNDVGKIARSALAELHRGAVQRRR